MKHTIFSILLTLLCTTSFAQMQQGVVKTPTRRNVNGTMTKGRYIENATVGILFANNNSKQSYISGTKGTFSFSASSPYYVTSVVANKGTYTFLDADFAKKQRKFSTDTIDILVDDPNVPNKIREEAIAHERGKIRNQIRAKEDELNRLIAEKKISNEEYNKMLDELTQYRNSSEAIVKQIAEVYATKDFDALDDFNKQLLIFVEEGNFASADSLLKTQGTKEELYNRIKKNSAAINKTKEELKLAEEYNNKEKDAFAQRLYSEYLMYLQQPMMQDSALYCLKMRADLDTTSIRFLYEYSDLCQKQKKFKECEIYYKMCLRACKVQNDVFTAAGIQHNLGILYSTHSSVLSERFFKASLNNYEVLNRKTPNVYRSYLSAVQLGLANLFSDQHKNEISEIYYKEALSNIELSYKQNPDNYYSQLLRTYGELGNFYSGHSNSALAEKYYMLAIEGYEKLTKTAPNENLPHLALTQYNTGNYYLKKGLLENSLRHYKQSVDNYETLYKQNPDAYCDMYVKVHENLSVLYDRLNDPLNRITHLTTVCKIYERLYKKYPKGYQAKYVTMHTILAYTYASINQFKESIGLIDKLITSIPQEAYLYNCKGEIRLMQGKNDEALKMWKKVLELNPDFLKDYPDGTDLSNELKKLGLIK